MKMAPVIASPRDFMAETPQICGLSCSLIHRLPSHLREFQKTIARVAWWIIHLRRSTPWRPWYSDHRIGWWEHFPVKPLYLMVFLPWFPVKIFSTKPIHFPPPWCSLSPRHPPDFMVQLPKPVEPGAVRMPLSPWLQYHKVGKLMKINLKVSP